MRIPSAIYIEKEHNLECGSQQLQYYTATMLVKPYITLPTPGDFPDSMQSIECQECRDRIKKSLKGRFVKFPLCCRGHQNLLELNEFNKMDYMNVTDMTADKIIYCCHHIKNCQGKEDWKQDILEYLEYTINSFGMFPEGYGIPLLVDSFVFYLLHIIERESDLKEEVKIHVISYLKGFSKPKPVNNKNSINLLIKKYNMWLKLFPFDLPLFSEAKKYFEKRLPFITEKISYNRYSNESKVLLISEEELIKNLFETTNQLLDKIDFSKITDNPEIVDFYNKVIVDYLYKIECKELLNSFHKNEVEYIELLKRWFCVQARYFKKIKDIAKLDTQAKCDVYEDSYKETLARIDYYKTFIESKDGNKLVNKEIDAQITFKAIWYNTAFDVNREVGNGRGFVDYTISKGANDKTLVEFKLASNTKLKDNLRNQLSIYSKANDTQKCITIILFFNEKEYKRIKKILKELKLVNTPNIITIDASNKVSASCVV